MNDTRLKALAFLLAEATVGCLLAGVFGVAEDVVRATAIALAITWGLLALVATSIAIAALIDGE